jgi:hypothetical protein
MPKFDCANFGVTTLPKSESPARRAAALSLSTNALTVAGYQRAVPRAVRIPSAMSPSVIA